MDTLLNRTLERNGEMTHALEDIRDRARSFLKRPGAHNPYIVVEQILEKATNALPPEDETR